VSTRTSRPSAVPAELVNVTFISDALGRNVACRVSTSAEERRPQWRLDGFLQKARAANLRPVR